MKNDDILTAYFDDVYELLENIRDLMEISIMQRQAMMTDEQFLQWKLDLEEHWKHPDGIGDEFLQKVVLK